MSNDVPNDIIADEIAEDIAACTSRVMTRDSVMNLVSQYANLILKYGEELEEVIEEMVFVRISNLISIDILSRF
jgi:hypothetical protein